MIFRKISDGQVEVEETSIRQLPVERFLEERRDIKREISHWQERPAIINAKIQAIKDAGCIVSDKE